MYILFEKPSPVSVIFENVNCLFVLNFHSSPWVLSSKVPDMCVIARIKPAGCTSAGSQSDEPTKSAGSYREDRGQASAISAVDLGHCRCPWP